MVKCYGRITICIVSALCALNWKDWSEAFNAFFVHKPHKSTVYTGQAWNREDPNCPVYGRFQDIDVVCVEWRTRPLEEEIPISWLAKKLHNWSARKIVSKKQPLPAPRDLYQSSIYVTLSQEGFLEFRSLIQRCIPGAASLAVKLPKQRFLRWLLKMFMKDVKDTHLECGFWPEKTGRNLVVRAVSYPKGELQGRYPIYSPYSSFQEILQKWDGKRYSALPFRRANGNEFARDSLLWCAEQPLRPV